MKQSTCTGWQLRRQIAASVIVMLPVLAGACNRHSPPSGQTIATVDGGEITTSDLQLELANTPPDQRKQIQPHIIQALVDRKVLAQYAVAQKMDRSPDYVLQLRQVTETLLANRAAQQIAAGARQPLTSSEINSYLDAHPDVAANRRLLTLDQITIPVPTLAVAKELKPARTIGEALAVLQRHNISPTRTQVQVDTATLPDDINAKLDHLQPGEPLVVLNQPNSTIDVIVDSKPLSVSGEDAETAARQRINADRANAALQQRGLALRRQAKITYAKGFAPLDQPATKP